jgi:hypothetical protein
MKRRIPKDKPDVIRAQVNPRKYVLHSKAKDKSKKIKESDSLNL